MSVDFVFLVMDAFAVFAMALIAIQYLCLLPTNVNAQLLAVLCLAAVCHVVLGRYQYGYWISEPYQIVSVRFSRDLLVRTLLRFICAGPMAQGW